MTISPITMPEAKTPRYPRSRASTARKVGSYNPTVSNTNEPDRPGKTRADTAMAAAGKTVYQCGSSALVAGNDSTTKAMTAAMTKKAACRQPSCLPRYRTSSRTISSGTSTEADHTKEERPHAFRIGFDQVD